MLYYRSPSVGITSYVGLKKRNSYRWKNVLSLLLWWLSWCAARLSLFNPLSWHFGVINVEVESFDDNKVSVWVHFALSIALLRKVLSKSTTLQVIAHSGLVKLLTLELHLQLLSIFISFAAASPRFCLFPSPVTTWSHPRPPLPTVRPRQQAFFKDTWLWSVCLWASQAPVCNDVVAAAAAAVCLFTFRSHLEFISDVFASRESLAETHHTHIYTCPVFLFSQACHHNDKIGDIPLLRSI